MIGKLRNQYNVGKSEFQIKHHANDWKEENQTKTKRRRLNKMVRIFGLKKNNLLFSDVSNNTLEVSTSYQP